MKVLVITRHYLDENLGGPNCSKAFVRAISTIYPETTLIFPEHNDHTTAMPWLQSSTCRLMPCYDHRHKLAKLTDVYRGRLHRFSQFVKRALTEEPYDLIILDHSVTASSGIMGSVRKTGARIATLHHNVEAEYLKDNPNSILYRWPYNHFALQAERQALLHSDINLVLTQADAEKFAAMMPQIKGTIKVLGMFEYENTQEKAPTAACPQSAKHAPHFVVSGSLQAAQTETAVLAFIADYLPRLTEAYPDCLVTIAGRNPSPAMRQACQACKNIQLIPSPPNLMAEIRKADYYLCPLNTGGGIKLRIMDALRQGLPVVAHANATRGYECLISDGTMWSYNSPETMLASIREMMNATSDRAENSAIYYRHFSFDNGCRRLRDILSTVSARKDED